MYRILSAYASGCVDLFWRSNCRSWLATIGMSKSGVARTSADTSTQATSWCCPRVRNHAHAHSAFTHRHTLTHRDITSPTHCSGHWYGYVTPTNLPDLFAAVQRGEVVEALLRGKMHR